MRDGSIGSGRHSTARVCRLRGGEATGKDPTNRGKMGSKRHIVMDRRGLPLAVTVSASNTHDSKWLEESPLRLPGGVSKDGALVHAGSRLARQGGEARVSDGLLSRGADGEVQG